MPTVAKGAVASAVGLVIAGFVPGFCDDANAQGARGALEEVVVTARRREESVQDVPLSITAFGNEQLEQRNITNMENLNTAIPNIAINGGGVTGPSQGTFHMRGIPGVAVYVDGVAKTGNNGLLLDVVELDRIEVLRGPQGTLFGKNAIGGAIQFVTRKPQEEFGVRVKTAIGSNNRLDAIVNADIPLTDTLFAKVSGAYVERGGYVDSQVINKKYGGTQTQLARGMLLWRPTDKFQALAILERDDWYDGGQAEITWSMDTPLYAAAGYDTSNETNAYGARHEFKNTMDYNGPGGFALTDNYVLDLTWDLSDKMQIRSITGGRDQRWANHNDLDGTQFDVFQQWFYAERQEFSEELQFNYSGDRTSGTAGLYYFKDTNGNHINRWLQIELNELSTVGGEYNFAETQGLPPGWRNDGGADETHGWAVFGEFTVNLTDPLALTAGVRYTKEHPYSKSCVMADELGVYPLRLTESVECASVIVDGSSTFDEVTPRLSLQYSLDDQKMVYLTYSKGFSAGGFDFNSAIDPDHLLPYGPEILNNYEIGWRSDLLGGRLRFNAAAFFGKWSDIQVAAEITPATLTTVNAGTAEVKGYEIEGIWAPTDHFRLDYAYGHLDPHYTDVSRTDAVSEDSRFRYASDDSYSIGAQYDWDLSSGAMVSGRLDYGYQSEYVTTLDVVRHSLQPGYGLLGARLAYTSSDNRWEVALSGTNLTNEFYQMSGFLVPVPIFRLDMGTVGRPREVAMSFRVSFD